MTDGLRIVICHDGSQGAEHALTEAARLFPGARATIVRAWSHPKYFGGIGAAGPVVMPPDLVEETAVRLREETERVAEAAKSRAQAAGLDAETDVRETVAPVWRVLLEAADEAGADLIVVGSRGFGELRALALGSVSQALAHHSHRPLLIVPPAEES